MQRLSSQHLTLLFPMIFASLFCSTLSGTTLHAQQKTTVRPSDTLIQPLAQTADSTTQPEMQPSFSTSADQNPSDTRTNPKAPQPQPSNQTADQTDDQTGKQSKRILGVIPNFRAVDADVKLPPQSPRQKFADAAEDSFDYSSIFIPAALALYGLEINSVPEFGHGGVGYGRYLWHAAADQTIENFMVEFAFPVATHEDSRYYTLGHGGFIKRTGYALSRAVITRSDSGKEVFNISEVVGAGASAGISTLYYPTAERSFSNTATSWGLDVGIDAASFVAKEFWPDINHSLFHGAKPSRASASPQPKP